MARILFTIADAKKAYFNTITVPYQEVSGGGSGAIMPTTRIAGSGGAIVPANPTGSTYLRRTSTGRIVTVRKGARRLGKAAVVAGGVALTAATVGYLLGRNKKD